MSAEHVKYYRLVKSAQYYNMKKKLNSQASAHPDTNRLTKQKADLLASKINAEINGLEVLNTPNERLVRKKYTKILQNENPALLFELAFQLIFEHGKRWVAYELIHFHTPTFNSLTANLLEKLGNGINSWGSVDSFARTLSGPAWRDGLVEDDLIEKWAFSDDFWWRRAALASTVALNLRSQGGRGDVERTLKICSLLVNDHEDMVVKALSWALRELVVHDPEAVQHFLESHDSVLAARVKREVINKLVTGLKYRRK
jgi:3-methyladenine DNA glycosylase AlkD